MIIAENLRIGNWVEYLGEWHYVQCIDPFRVHLMGNLLDTKLEEINPIPLSPAILEKAGFVCEKIQSYEYWDMTDKDGYKLNYLSFRRNEIAAFGIIGRKNKDHFQEYTQNHHRVFYLHQLQNIVHSLTGKELEINFTDND